MPKETQPYVIVRTDSAGAFAGELVRRNGAEAELRQARRLWYWEGAASLSGLAARGTSLPARCKFPSAVEVILVGVTEIIACTPEARASIEGVPEWKA